MVATGKLYAALPYLQIAGFAVLLARLYLSNLSGVYRAFSLYAAIALIRLIVLAALPYGKNIYAQFYFVSETIIWILCALALLEVYGMVLRNHSGIATLGRWALTGSVGASIVLSMCTLLLDYQNSAVKYPILDNFLLLSRLVMVSLLLFVLFIGAFLMYFPVELSRNTVLHCRIFSVYFLVKASTYMAARIVPPEALLHVNAAIQVMITLCCVFWAIWLTPQGERTVSKMRQHWDAGQEERLMSQLDAINRTLVHSAKD
jgi:hypothetical protein